jgi:hypothetical protein
MTEYLQGLQGRFMAGGFDSVTAYRKALGVVYIGLEQQASLLAYADNFRLLGYLSLLCIPVALIFNKVRRHGPPETVIEP